MVTIAIGVLGLISAIFLRRSSSRVQQKYADYIALLSIGVIAVSIALYVLNRF